jgi:dTDP-4-amino-4,6-dideoxygalactose transaminase
MQTAEPGEAVMAGGAARRGSADPVLEYERRYAQRAGAPLALSFSHARAALAAVLESCPANGTEVLLSPLTCKVVPLAVLSAGLQPVYVDIREDTLNVDPSRLETALGLRTRAVLFQRTYGLAGGAVEAVAAARRHGVMAIEDCAQCMPSPDAWFADAAVFSNNPGKPLPAGSGGMLVLRDEAMAERVIAIRTKLPGTSPIESLRPRFEAWVRNHLLSPRLYWTAFELNRRIDSSYEARPRETEIRSEVTRIARQLGAEQAAAGSLWLDRADAVAGQRVRRCAAYASALVGQPGLVLPASAGDSPLYFFPVLVEGKRELLHEAKRRRIEIIAWPLHAPIYPLQDVRSLGTYGYEPGTCPVAEGVAKRLVGLPTHPLVRSRDIAQIIDLVKAHAVRASHGEDSP